MWVYQTKTKKESITTPSRRMQELAAFLQVIEQITPESPTIEEVRRAFPTAYKLCAAEFELKSSSCCDKYIRQLKEANSKTNLGTERFAMLVTSWLNGNPTELREVLKDGIVNLNPDLNLIRKTLALHQKSA